MVDRRLRGLCDLFGSRVRDGKGAIRESFPEPRGEGVCAAREGTWRNVDVFRVRVEVGDELVLEDAAGLPSDTITGEDVEANGGVGTLSG
jgi:hypothetical protein